MKTDRLEETKEIEKDKKSLTFYCQSLELRIYGVENGNKYKKTSILNQILDCIQRDSKTNKIDVVIKSNQKKIIKILEKIKHVYFTYSDQIEFTSKDIKRMKFLENKLNLLKIKAII